MILFYLHNILIQMFLLWSTIILLTFRTRFSFRSSEGSSNPPPPPPPKNAPPLHEGSGYVVPKFDFDKLEEEEHPPNIDMVLEEIEHQHDVIEVAQSLLSVQLVLNVNTASTPQTPGLKQSQGSKRKISTIDATGGSKDAKHPLRRRGSKAVKFTDEQEESGLSDKCYLTTVY